MQPLVARRRRPLVVAAVAGAVIVAAILLWFEPQAALIDRTVREAAPAAVARDDGGGFVSLAHGTTGTAAVLTDATGARVLRIEDLATENGPDVRVLLSPAAVGDGGYEAGAVELGELRGNIGDQNYPIPAGVDPAAFRSVVIWCERFSVAFGAAPLRAA